MFHDIDINQITKKSSLCFSLIRESSLVKQWWQVQLPFSIRCYTFTSVDNNFLKLLAFSRVLSNLIFQLIFNLIDLFLLAFSILTLSVFLKRILFHSTYHILCIFSIEEQKKKKKYNFNIWSVVRDCHESQTNFQRCREFAKIGTDNLLNDTQHEEKKRFLFLLLFKTAWEEGFYRSRHALLRSIPRTKSETATITGTIGPGYRVSSCRDSFRSGTWPKAGL